MPVVTWVNKECGSVKGSIPTTIFFANKAYIYIYDNI